MCGIVGYTGSDIDIVKRAHALQHHRGPDDEGFFSDEYVSLGHNRLAIIDLNPRSAQPMWDVTHRFCIVFNGEIYNYKALKETYLKDYTFQTESDTEVILALFTKFSTHITQYLHGMYAFSIYDTEQQELYLFRDTYGIKPLFYSLANEQLFFASELKSVVSLLGQTNIPLTIDTTALHIYLQLGYTIAPATLYENIKILEAGHHLIFNLKQHTLTIAKNPALTFFGTSNNTIQSSIVENTVSDVPVGVFFSGGIDSSLIVSVLKSNKLNLKTFTLGIENRNTDEIYSRKIAEILEIEPKIIPFGVREFDATYKEVVKNIDHPAGATSLFQTSYLAKQTAKEVKVVLMGDGGDELFYGYARTHVLHKLEPQTYKQGHWLEWCFLLTPYFPLKNKVYSKLFQTFKLSVSYYLLEMSIARDSISSDQWFATKKAICNKQIKPTHYDLELYLKNDLLHKNDLATAYYALEGRVPLLAEQIEILLRAEAESSLSEGIAKKYLRALLSQYLPAALFDRKKLGFGLHYASIVSASAFVKADFDTARAFLKQYGIQFKSFEYYEKKSPQYCLVVTNLYHALKNNERFHSQIS